MPGPIFLRGERVTLNVIGDDDVPFLYETINDPEVRAGLSFARPKTERAEREWVESVTDPDADDVHFLICDDGDSIGTVGLRNLDTRTGNAEIGCYLTPDAWGKGHATDAVRVLLGHAFEQLRLHRVHARAVADNEGSKRVLEKVGFEREGVMREHWYRDGDYQDVHVYGLLADEWRG